MTASQQACIITSVMEKHRPVYEKLILKVYRRWVMSTDVRASAEYRGEMTKIFTRRAIKEAVAQ